MSDNSKVSQNLINLLLTNLFMYHSEMYKAVYVCITVYMYMYHSEMYKDVLYS